MKAEKRYTVSAQRINEALIDAGLKAQDLVERTGIAKASISHYVNGYYCPTASKARRIGEVLGVNPLWIMGFDVPKYAPAEKEKVSKEFIKDIITYLRDGDVEESVEIEKSPARQEVDSRLNGYDEKTLERLLTYLDFFEKMNKKEGDKK